MSSQNEEQGWVPANYLERRVLEGPLSHDATESPPPEPFQDDTGELADLMLKYVYCWWEEGVVSQLKVFLEYLISILPFL